MNEPEVTYVDAEALTSGDYLDKPVHTDRYVAAFASLRMVAESDRVTAKMLNRTIEELT